MPWAETANGCGQDASSASHRVYMAHSAELFTLELGTPMLLHVPIRLRLPHSAMQRAPTPTHLFGETPRTSTATPL